MAKLYEDKLKDAVSELREYCGGIPLSNAIMNIIDYNKCATETINYYSKENAKYESQCRYFDEKYTESLLKIRELKEQITQLESERDLYKSSMNHYKGITLKKKSKLEEEVERLKAENAFYKRLMDF